MTGETDNEMIDSTKSDSGASTDSEGEFQPVRRKKKDKEGRINYYHRRGINPKQQNKAASKETSWGRK
ncbi:hypothetical protein GWI33_020837 [Rhynchophorus ferrugineus]|uniref:Uncharacterized protein n=1 Tax=Rhynchophorus ferrugineus TaxID=354439 RepID=A0A834HNS8_RHYFE|nr:hypothetical protein GWI33_020837 [Rhynchophorus ferrugineus]